MRAETTDLLVALDALHASGRAAHLSAWAAAASAEVRRAVRADLVAGDGWQRGLALSLAAWDRDAAALLAALGDASVSVRRLAATFAARGVTDGAALVTAALDSDPETRSRLILQVARRRRRDVAATLARALLDRGEVRAARPLLCLAPNDVVDEVQAVLGLVGLPWRTLAVTQPEATLARMEAGLAAAPNAQARQRLWTRFGPGLPRLARAAVAQLDRLLRAYPPQTGAPRLPILGALLRHDAAGTIDEVLALGNEQGWLRLGHRRRLYLRALRDAELVRLAVGLAEHPEALTQVLRALPPARRAAPFDAVCAARPQTLWPLSLLAHLPHTQRRAQARRLFAQPEVQASPAQQQALWGWLPVEDVLPICLTDGRPRQRDATERAAAWLAWIQAVGRDRRGLDAVLAVSRYLHNEQDPLRAAFWSGLAGLPVALIEAEQLPVLDALLVATLEARDTSFVCRYHLNALAHRLLRAHGQQPEGPLFKWGLRILERCMARDGDVSLPGLEAGLPRGSEQAIAAAVLAWLRADVSRALARGTLSLARALGRRAWGVPDLQALLEALALDRLQPHTRAAAIDLWLAGPADRDTRVRRLIDSDASAATLSIVWRHLDRHRQNWLDPYLKGAPLKGAWGHAKVGWLPSAPEAAQRWLPRQQRALAAQYLALAGHDDEHLSNRARVIGQMARLPAATLADLQPLIDHPTVNLAEAALGALAHLDEPGPGLAVVLNHLDSDRARVATYVLPRLARLLPGAILGTHLAGVLARPKLRVTVHKEVVRLLGAYAPAGADDLLQQAWRRPAVHRDVRIALVHAARSRLPAAWAWNVLDEAATDADAELPKYLTLTRTAEVPAAHHARLLEVLLKVAGHADPLARLALVNHLARDADGLGAAAPMRAAAVLARMWFAEGAASVVADDAGGALLAVASLPGALGTLGPALEGLGQALATEPAVPATPKDPDLPFTTRLETLVYCLAGRTLMQRPRYAPLCEAFATHPVLADRFRLRAQLLLAQHPGTGSLAPLETLARAATDPGTQSWLMGALQSAVADVQRPWPVPDLLDLETSLGESALPRLGLVRGAGIRHGWSKALIARLAALREHPVAGVEARAFRIW